ncbi:hypothetical protein MPER_05441 [Moniliophthora perniciosa FA553]|nr:hypothetical protein MPER_05441 [Moniliophthora perniciosa FA553]
MFRRHLHMHPSIPINGLEKHLQRREIHTESTEEMYRYCRMNNLSQAWAYLYNRWYNKKQWILWARSACSEIPRLKTTMIVEGTWKQLKRRDLPQFNRPRLDLVTHVILNYLRPRVQRKLSYLKGKRRLGRARPLAKWQECMKARWKDLSKLDELRSMERELTCLRDGSLKEVTRAELLAEIEA